VFSYKKLEWSMNYKSKVGMARSVIGVLVLSFCVYLLLSDPANAATVVDGLSQKLL
jgi:hypothetical protein